MITVTCQSEWNPFIHAYSYVYEFESNGRPHVMAWANLRKMTKKQDRFRRKKIANVIRRQFSVEKVKVHKPSL